MKHFTVFLSILLSAVSGDSQVIQNLGVKMGLSIANQTWHYETINTNLRKDYRSGFYTALTVEGFRGRNLSMVADIGFVQKGSREEVEQTFGNGYTGTGDFVQYRNRFNYVFINPLLKARHEMGSVLPYAVLGARIDLQTSYNSDMDYGSFDQNFRKVLFGMTYGVGVEYKRARLGFSMEIQRQIDFTSLLKMESTKNSTGLEIKNTCYIVSWGVRYYFRPLVKEEVE